MGYNFRNTETATPALLNGNVNLTLKSRNKKTGDIPASTSGKQTCPDSCALKQAKICYAMTGPLGLFWAKVSAGDAGVSFEQFCKQVAALPDGQLWRHNQSGDLQPSASDRETIDAPKLLALVEANRGRRGRFRVSKIISHG